ncbi:MAG: peptidoglycan DD-metalloendopeptidase family protein [Parvularculaceae bacterium]
MTKTLSASVSAVRASIAAIVASLGATACVSETEAPVVYGSEPTWTGRVYRSPEEVKTEAASARQREARAPIAAPTQPVVTASAPPTKAERQRFDYDAQPRYLAADLITDVSARSEDAPTLTVSPVAEARVAAPVDRGRVIRLEPLNAPERAAKSPAKKSDSVVVAKGDIVVAKGDIVVAKGDTVYAISRRTGAAPQDIINANDLQPPYSLEIGDKLVVPADAKARPQRLASLSQPKQRATRATPPAAKAATHTVRKGETLYRIATNAGSDVRTLARLNRLSAPYELSVGQKLRVPASRAAGAPARKSTRAAAKKPVALAPQTTASLKPSALKPAASVPTKTASREPVAPKPSDIGPSVEKEDNATPEAEAADFRWPVRGAILKGYDANLATRNDGVDIGAPTGTPVRAAADGEVVYRGAELDDYGNLLLIRHEDGFVTAYAHNDVMIAKKGDYVRQGQIIAKVGQTGDADQPQLHFEIRRNLKAIDPLALLDN